MPQFTNENRVSGLISAFGPDALADIVVLISDTQQR
jgi:hypothetical protein